MLPFSRLSGFILLASYQVRASSISSTTYTASGAFPTSLYGSYWNDPTATSAQPQPVITDPVTNEIFPYELTDPANFPKNDTVDPHPLPTQATPSQLMEQALAQIIAIATNPVFGDDTCTKCQASLAIAKMLVLGAPEQGPLLAEAVCQYFDYSTTCYDEYSALALGSTFSQVLALANAGGYDGQNLCSHIGLCSVPPAVPLNMTGWFATPKPNPLPPPIQPSGERLKVFHISDIHLDPRYAIGSEGNCSAYMCCRENAFNAATPDQIVLPAARFGSYWCDSPLDLMAAAMEAIGPLTGTEQSGFNFSIFTGDLTAHDSDNQYSRAYVEYEEVVFYGLLKKFAGPAPVYPTIGNHDTYMQFQMIPYTMGGTLGTQFNWLYEHISSMWQYEGWLPEASVAYASTHYAAYTVTRPDGLKIISLDTNLWYTDNYYSYINSTEPDPYGILRFLTDELQASEDAGERVWIIGHVLSGWDGTASQVNPTNLCTIDRFSPHVIANIFYGHTHEDQLSIFYANNGTVMTAETALTASWIGPSLTPLTNLNSGFRMYEIDSAASFLSSPTFDILDAYTYVSNVNEFPALDNQTQVGPSYYLEYSTRDAYGGNITWGANDPLNATWWHLVTEQMLADPTLVQTFNTYQSKSSVAGLDCTGECIPAKTCYMRSGSSSLAYQNCPAGYSSTQ
ncbi:sphingomyelin phosphodiesterase [Suillus subluteus]|nr:sphingomyelin phosphodiesterase [Suillus subluteus]